VIGLAFTRTVVSNLARDDAATIHSELRDLNNGRCQEELGQ
jgi:hypothetical protein